DGAGARATRRHGGASRLARGAGGPGSPPGLWRAGAPSLPSGLSLGHAPGPPGDGAGVLRRGPMRPGTPPRRATVAAAARVVVAGGCWGLAAVIAKIAFDRGVPPTRMA